MKMDPILQRLTPIQPFPVEGKGYDPLLPSMGRTPQGCRVATRFSKESRKEKPKTLPWVLLSLFALTACGQTGIRKPTLAELKTLPRPSRILLYDFAASEREVTAYQGIMRQQTVLKDSAERERLLAKEVKDALAEEVVAGLRALGFTVERVNRGTIAAGNDLLIAGQFLAIDEGNPLRRLVIGFGSGNSMVESRVQLYQGAEARKLLEFTTHSDSGRLPGAAPTIGGGAVVQGGLTTGMVVLNAATSGIKMYNSGVARMAAASGDQVVRYLSEFFGAQGWIRPDQVRKARIVY